MIRSPRLLLIGLWLALVVTLGGLARGPAVAAQEDEGGAQISTSEIDTVLAECDGFELTEEATETRIYTIVVDDQGNDVQGISRILVSGVITNSATGDTFRSRGNYVHIEDWEAGEETWLGTLLSISDEDGEVLIQDTGSVVFDASGEAIVRDGEFDYTFSDDPEEFFCSVLA